MKKDEKGGKLEMLEREIEEYLRKKVKATGGLAYKWVSPGNNGVPDRIVVGEFGVIFVELKSSTGKLTNLQRKHLSFLRGLGLYAIAINSKEQVDKLIEILEVPKTKSWWTQNSLEDFIFGKVNPHDL